MLNSSNQCLTLKSDLIFGRKFCLCFLNLRSCTECMPIIGGLFRRLISFWNAADMAQVKFHADHNILRCSVDEFF